MMCRINMRTGVSRRRWGKYDVWDKYEDPGK